MGRVSEITKEQRELLGPALGAWEKAEASLNVVSEAMFVAREQITEAEEMVQQMTKDQSKMRGYYNSFLESLAKRLSKVGSEQS